MSEHAKHERRRAFIAKVDQAGHNLLAAFRALREASVMGSPVAGHELDVARSKVDEACLWLQRVRRLEDPCVNLKRRTV